jgi:dihydroorotate dehydrogenase
MKFEKASLPISYYELNISCPNLVGNVSFYSKENLHQLLIALTMLKIHKPVFVKMPISISNNKFIEICETIKDFRFIKGLIIGNLQKDRNNDELQKKEIIKWKTGNFSGKPTFERSNELIALTRKKYRSRYIIIGCGGIFTVDDANKKINSGADLIQMITGMIFEGPFRVKEISLELN